MTHFVRLCAYAVLSSSAFAVPLGAATLSVPMTATLTLPSQCTVSVPATIDFGTLTADASGGVSGTQQSFNQSLVCTNGASWNIYHQSGNGSGLNFLMKNAAGSTLSYNTSWSSNTGDRWLSGPNFPGVHQTGGTTEVSTSYITIPQQSGVAVGNYTDTLTVGIVF